MRTIRFSSLALAIAIAAAATSGTTVSAQNVASNKAFFAKDTNGTTFVTVGIQGNSQVATVMSIPAALKTSNGGAISATLSMEAALWTYNVTTAINQGGKASSSSRAALKVWIEVDGQQMEPGLVVYADRLQATGLTLNLTCAVPGTTCTVGGNAILELFQATKEANSFTFFAGPLPPTVHRIDVKAQSFIECRANAVVIPCPAATLDGYTDASTQAAIGKATLLIEEHQNWGKSGS
jgi:hypothetical protein